MPTGVVMITIELADPGAGSQPSSPRPTRMGMGAGLGLHYGLAPSHLLCNEVL